MGKSTVSWTRSAGVGVAALIGLAAMAGVTGCAQPELKSEMKELPQGLKGTGDDVHGGAGAKSDAQNQGSMPKK